MPAHHFVNTEHGCFSAVYGLLANGGMGQLWNHFLLKGLSVPDAIKPYCPGCQTQEGSTGAPSPITDTHPDHTLSFLWSSPARRISGILKAISLWNDVQFHDYLKDTPPSPVRGQAAKTFFRPQFVQTQN